jgi:hypothetical protein
METGREGILKIQKLVIVFVVILFVVSSMNARSYRRVQRSVIELAPKATLYIGDDTDFGIGVEGIFNPTRNFGLRLNLTELRFDNTTFCLNYWQSLDALFYYPMSGWDTYFHAGFGMISIDTGGSSWNIYEFRGGMGFNYPMSSNYLFFVEPGLIIMGNGDTDVILRVAAGLKFGMVR